MNGMMCRYYIFKKIVEKLPENILSNLNIPDDKLLNLADFLSTPLYYKGNPNRDKYKVYELLTGEKFYEFFTEVLIATSKKFSNDGLLFCYALICYKLENEILLQFLEEIKNPTTDINEALNMLDYYYAKKLDDIDLKKTNLVFEYPDGFKYLDFIEGLIHQPIIRTINLFETNNYFKKAYKKKTHFYNYYTKSKFGFTRLYLKLKRTISNSVLRRHTFYSDKMDTAILNMQKNTFMLGDREYNFTLEELVNFMMKQIYEYISAINEYLLMGKDKKIKKILNISSEKNM